MTEVQVYRYRAGGVITVYLSLVILLFVSVILVCMESARVAVLQTSAERYADMAAEMTFSAYVRPLARRYGIFVLDPGEGGRVEEIFEDCLKLNLLENKENTGRPFALYGQDADVRLLSSSKLKDNKWDALYEQIRRSELYALGEDGLGGMLSFLRTGELSEAGKLKEKVQDTVKEKEEAAKEEKKSAEEEKKEKEQEETAKDKKEQEVKEQEEEKKEEGTDPRPGITRWLKSGLLELVMGDAAVSSRTISLSGCSYKTGKSRGLSMVRDFGSSRSLQKSLGNSSLEKMMDEEDDAADAESLTSDHAGKKSRQMLLNLYILDKFTSLTEGVKEGGDHVLKYEVEYILYGSRSDRVNLENTIMSLCALRTALNLAWLYTDGGKTAQVSRAVSSFAASALPVAGELIALLVMACWAGAEAVVDCSALVDGKKIPIWKSDANWQLSFSALTNLASEGGSPGSFAKGSSHGLTYNQYLLLLLISRASTKKVIRMLQLMEKNVQLESGYEKFSLKRCLTGAVFGAKVSIAPRFFRHPSAVSADCRCAYAY